MRALPSACRLLAFFAALACSGPAPAASPEPAGSDGVTPSWLDPTAAPCSNFFRFACGGWIDANPIPADETRWGVDMRLADQNRTRLRDLLEEAAARPTAETRKIGDFYASCMDETRVESLGATPLAPLLARIDGLTEKGQLAALVADLHRRGVGVFFGFGASPDMKNADIAIAVVDEGGRGLPDRETYLSDDPENRALRRDYRAHVARMLALAGASSEAADRDADSVLAIETRLAKAALDPTARRDPQKLYHPFTRSELDRLAPDFGWTSYFGGVKAEGFDRLNVTEPDFVRATQAIVADTPLPSLQAYLRWHLVSHDSNWLSKPFVEEDFAFYGKRLTGADALKPRWKRCVEAVDEAMGEDLGRAYVARYFPPEAKARTLAMVSAIAASFADTLGSLDWMGPETRRKALEKLAAIRKKIGYPDHWRDYGALVVERDDLVGNIARATSFELGRQVAKIGKPVDRSEWLMTPPTVNAYYDPQTNEIDLPAGILQPPFFSERFDDAVNFGATGAGTIGHELTHAFDDEGRQYDAKGNLADWWSPADATRFKSRAQCLVDQYGGYVAVGKTHVNGALTLGENVADLGGVRLGYAALMKVLAGKAMAPIGGFTPAQRYFLAYAQSWCGASRPEALKLGVATDPHSPVEFRVNGVVSNLPEFRAAFACPAAAPMVRAKSCKVW